MITDLRLAARALRRGRGASALQLATVAIGVGGLTAVLAVVSAVALRGLPFDEPGQLVAIEVTSSRGFSISNSIPNLRDWRDRNRTLASAGGRAPWSFRMTRGDQAEIIEGAAVYGDLFTVLRLRPALGRLFTAAETEPGTPPVAVLGYGFWQRAFAADESILGTTVHLDGTPYTITGVLPRGVAFPRTEPSVMVNMGSIAGLPWNDRGSSFGTRMYGRLRDHVSVAAAAADIDRVGREVKEENGPLTAVPTLRTLSEDLIGDRDRQLYLLLAAVGVVMLIATLNVGSLVLARAADQRRDAAVRLSLGGSAADIRRQFIAENVLLTTAGGALGLVLAVGLVRALVPMLPDDLPQSLLDRIAVDGPTVAGVLVACAIVGAGLGAIAATHVMPRGLLAALRSASGSIVTPRTRARSTLLVAETALSLVLAIGAGLLLSSFNRLRSVDKGFDDRGVLIGRITPSAGATATPEQWVNYHTRVIEAAQGIPGVSRTAVALNLPLTNRSNELRIQPFGSASPVDEGPSVQYNQVSNEYFAALSIPIVAGRTFTAVDDNAGTPVAIIDESMAELFWPGQDPIGQRVTIGEQTPDQRPVYRTVVGVVSNVRHYTLREPARIQLYVPVQGALARSRGGLTVVAAGSVPPGDLIAPMRRALLAIDPGLTFWGVQPLSRYVDGSISSERTLGVITTWLAMVAALVTAVGLFALVTYAVGQRRREIALRLALGATPREVVGLMTWSGASMGLLGVGIGLLGAAATTRLLSGFLFEVQPLDPSVYVVAGVVVFGVTAIASLMPALGARRMAPAAVLREE